MLVVDEVGVVECKDTLAHVVNQRQRNAEVVLNARKKRHDVFLILSVQMTTMTNS